MVQPVLIGGQWRDAHASSTFHAEDPQTGEALPDQYPVSTWEDCDEALTVAAATFQEMLQLPASAIAEFLERYAERIEQRRDALVDCAHAETGLARTPRLADVELPRTTGQLRQAAAAARSGNWTLATIDTEANIRAWLAPLGPVIVFGPNNFPFAFGSISGGDFAAAIAAGNPVIAKANSSHPGTTRIFAEEAIAAARETPVPEGIVQLIYRTSHADGELLVSDPRVGATGYTGSRSAGLKLKAAADQAGKPIYLELSSINPVMILPGALTNRLEAIVEEFATSCLMGTGQFCTNPGLILLLEGQPSHQFVQQVAQKFDDAAVGPLLSRGVQQSLREGIDALASAGAERVTTGRDVDHDGYRVANTLLRTTAAKFLDNASVFQTEAFGNASLCVVADDAAQLEQVVWALEGNLTGCIYSDEAGGDEELYRHLAPVLRQKVGRLINDKMPTGVAVSAAMNHGGPYPATGHPGFTAVGVPAALRRFAMLQCYDAVRHDRLPEGLQNKNPSGSMWRLIDGRWTCDDVV
jgi:NADP-dependent aldehyde dehydrogenase